MFLPPLAYHGAMNATPRPSVFETILLDLDGTLTDPQEGITRSIRYALARLGLPDRDPHSLRCFIGPPLLESMRERIGLCEADARRAVAAYREYFAERGLYENAVFPGIGELLGELAAAGRRLALATSKPAVYAERILEHFGLKHHFTVIAGSNLDGTRTAKPEVIAHALGLLGCAADPARVVMVGDREHDIFGARAHGLDCIGVSYGYGPEEELRAAGARWIAHSVEELRALLLGED